MSGAFRIYRYHHPDGRAKDWAWREDPGRTLTVRWGPAGRLAQRKTYPASALGRIGQTLQQKLRKGYVLLGEHRLDDQGRLLEPVLASTPGIPGVDVSPAIDLSEVETGIADDWF
ncbi:hypothetical protein G3480_05925 [Thiorhodococcus mannitoliphagus]|uniref:WGR domain-containing protein n=1 Tax=Thiorhodococcus mannitoliphagus TaxID=329406 RepID=A0A6P1DW49_9GAMM|nr:hypothetical protein [Thiorhodococcus mannitoliphagus]NEX19855.1 hypothetical protein [Thiorhodococcus mannitoliphagus]